MKSWFGRKAAPAARPLLHRAFSGSAGVGEWPRGYEAQVREAYLGNPVAQRAVRLVAESVAWAPVHAKDGEAGAAASAMALKLVGPALLDRAASQLLLHGNAFVQILLDADAAPAELFALRPERVTVESDKGGWPEAYVYRAGEVKARLAALDPLGRPALVHVRAMHPLDDHYGLGCLGAAAGAVAIHNSATRWNKALLDNAARPSGALSVEGGEGSLGAEQYERLRDELELHFAGTANAGRPLLLEGGLKWQAMSLTPADMDFVALKEGAARDIALAFGVPPVLVGLPGDATYANAREAGRALYRQTILPMAARILDGLGSMLGDWLGPVKLAVDSDQLSELAEDRAKLWEQVGAASFLSDGEKREMLGFAPAKESE